MHILLVTHFFGPRHTTGTENYTYGLARSLTARGHGVTVVCAEDWATGAAYWNGVTQDEYGGIPVYRAHLNWQRAADPNRALYDSHLAQQWLDTFLAREHPDVVHVTSCYSLGAGVLRSAAHAGIPLVLTLMDFWFLCPRVVLRRSDGELCDGRTSAWDCQQCLLTDAGAYVALRRVLPERLHAGLWQFVAAHAALSRLRGARGLALDVVERKAMLREALNLPDVVLSHSRAVADTFAGAGIDRPIRHVPNGHELSWLGEYTGKSPSPVLRFGFMGQVGASKGVRVLVEAFGRAGLEGKATLDVWGGLDKPDERAYVAELQAWVAATPGASLRGPFSRAQLAAVLAGVDVLVVPSLWYENAPLVIHEAFATRTPVIATHLGGMAEAVTHEVNGLLFARGDAAGLARQMRRVVEEPGLLDRLRAGIPRVKALDEETDELEDLYGGIIRAAHRARSLPGVE